MVKTRFSPSPTGLLHLGNVRTALFSALYALNQQGTFLLRIEDTDLARSEEKYITALKQDLQWLSIAWQEGPDVSGQLGPYFQSQRKNIYNQYYEQLVQEGHAYECFCTEQQLAIQRKLQLSRGLAPRYPGTCKKLSQDEVSSFKEKGLKPALRFSVDAHHLIQFVDLVKGPQQFKGSDIGDFIIRRADHSASFMFCNAIDDSLMGVTHALRGEDHLTNTPRQLMILSALKLRAPHYGHFSLITGDDGAPLSKRHGSFSLYDLRHEGYLPQALLNYIARLGHTYDAQTLLSYEQLATSFTLERLSKSATRFDKNQLLHWQKEAVLSLNKIDFSSWLGTDIINLVPANHVDLFLEMMQQNIMFPKEAKCWAQIFFTDALQFNDEQLALLKSIDLDFFVKAAKAFNTHGLEFSQVVAELNAAHYSGKKLYMPLRIALTGQLHGPELLSIIHLLGMQKVIQRINNVQAILNQSLC